MRPAGRTKKNGAPKGTALRVTAPVKTLLAV
jgi:hypothetical protein